MPFSGYDFREPPKDAVGLSAYAPSKPAEALSVEPPAPEKPVVKAPRKRTWQTKPKSNGIRITEHPVNMRTWDVSPYKIAEELGSE